MSDPPWKIGITCYPSAGGSGVVATELGLRLARRGHAVHFICHQQPLRLRGSFPRIAFHPVETASSPVFHHQPYSLNLAAKMTEVVERHDLDLLHVHYAIPHATSAVLARQIMRPRPLRVLTTLHGTDITLVGRHPSFAPVTRFSIEASDGVTVVSRWLAAETRAAFGVTVPLAVVHNFVDAQRFRPLSDPAARRRLAAASEPLLMHASNFRPLKNTPRLIEVLRAVRRRLPARLVMIGEGPELEVCRRRAQQAGLADAVRFLGSQESIESLLPLADCFLLPSAHESFGLVALEAMSCAVPVVATATGGTAEIIEEGTSGFLVDPEDVETMAARVVALSEQPGLRAAMGSAGRRRARQRFDIDVQVTRYEAIYARLLAGVPIA